MAFMLTVYCRDEATLQKIFSLLEASDLAGDVDWDAEGDAYEPGPGDPFSPEWDASGD